MSNSSLSKTFALGSSEAWFYPSKVSFGSEKNLGQKNFRSEDFFLTEKSLVQRKLLAPKNLGSHKILAPKTFVSEKILRLKKMLGMKKKCFSKKNCWSKTNVWSKKNCGSNKILGLKKIWVRKKFWIWKNFGSKNIWAWRNFGSKQSQLWVLRPTATLHLVPIYKPLWQQPINEGDVRIMWKRIEKVMAGSVNQPVYDLLRNIISLWQFYRSRFMVTKYQGIYLSLLLRVDWPIINTG